MFQRFFGAIGFVLQFNMLLTSFRSQLPWDRMQSFALAQLAWIQRWVAIGFS
jgi:hypothetical protein